jgi:hypothetical protein
VYGVFTRYGRTLRTDPHKKFERPDPQPLSVVQFNLVENSLAIDQRAIAAAVVSNEDPFFFDEQSAVVAADLLAMSPKMAVARTANQKTPASDRDFLARIPASDDLQQDCHDCSAWTDAQ